METGILRRFITIRAKGAKPNERPARAEGNPRPRLGWATVQLVAALALLASGCAREAPAAEEEPPLAFPVATPKPSDTFYEREYVGEVRAARYAEIRSRLKGVIEAVAVDEGQAVKSGDVLFSIGARELQQELLKARAATKSAEAELKLARLEQQNTQLLFEKNVVSEAEMALLSSKIDALSAKLEEAKPAESQANINLTYAKIRAPFDGVLNRIPKKVGSVVSEDDLLTTIADTSEVHVYFRVSEREYLEYQSTTGNKPPSEVSLRLADGRLHSSPGVIDAVESEVNRETGSLAFRAKFPNPDGTLKHGSSAKVVIKTDVRGALLVPQKSTFEVQGKLYVYVLDDENRAKAREIVPKVRLKDAFVVDSGITEKDRFVLEGVQKIKEGTRIEVLPPG